MDKFLQCIAIAALIMWAAMVGGAAYVVVHFVLKYW